MSHNSAMCACMLCQRHCHAGHCGLFSLCRGTVGELQCINFAVKLTTCTRGSCILHKPPSRLTAKHPKLTYWGALISSAVSRWRCV